MRQMGLEDFDKILNIKTCNLACLAFKIFREIPVLYCLINANLSDIMNPNSISGTEPLVIILETTNGSLKGGRNGRRSCKTH
jgi:hypothetical protein